jgi:hypothetical protein
MPKSIKLAFSSPLPVPSMKDRASTPMISALGKKNVKIVE